MALIDTIEQLHHLLTCMMKDLAKVQRGNRAASQRVRTGSIKLEKVAKVFRKESVQAEKTGKFKKRPAGKKRAKSKKKKR